MERSCGNVYGVPGASKKISQDTLLSYTFVLQFCLGVGCCIYRKDSHSPFNNDGREHGKLNESAYQAPTSTGTDTEMLVAVKEAWRDFQRKTLTFQKQRGSISPAFTLPITQNS